MLGCTAAPAARVGQDLVAQGAETASPALTVQAPRLPELKPPVSHAVAATPARSGTVVMARALIVLAIAVAGAAVVLLVGKGAKAPAASAKKPVIHVTSSSDPPATVTTVTVTTANTVTTVARPRRTRRAVRPAAGFAVSSGPDYTVEYPSGWSVAESNAPQSYNSTATASKFVDPSGSGAYILVAETGDSSTSAKFDATQQRDWSVSEPGYEELVLGPVRTPTGTGWQWEFRRSGEQKVDTFWHACGHGFAVLGSAPTGVWTSYEQTFAQVTDSFKTNPC